MATWARLVMACPACIANGLSSGPSTSWFHSNCGGALEVSDEAQLRCSHCGTQYHFSCWRWGCPRHGDSTKQSYYQGANASSVAAQISITAALSSRMGRRWLMKFLDYLGEW